MVLNILYSTQNERFYIQTVSPSYVKAEWINLFAVNSVLINTPSNYRFYRNESHPWNFRLLLFSYPDLNGRYTGIVGTNVVCIAGGKGRRDDLFKKRIGIEGTKNKIRSRKMET